MARTPRVTETIALDAILRDEAVNPREAIDPHTVAAYREDMRAGCRFPPVVVFRDNALRNWLLDGYHRIAAAVEAGVESFCCDVREGGKLTATWYARSANKTHGLRRTNEDKRRAVMTALQHPDGDKKSDNAIGKHCGVSHTTVAKYRAELESTCQVGKSDRREGADGRAINTANIGAKKDTTPEATTNDVVLPPGHHKPERKSRWTQFFYGMDIEVPAEHAEVLERLPQEQRQDAYQDFLDSCTEDNANPTVDGLAAIVDVWAADNEGVGGTGAGDDATVDVDEQAERDADESVDDPDQDDSNGKRPIEDWLDEPNAEKFVANISTISSDSQWIEDMIEDKAVVPAEVRGLLNKIVGCLDDAMFAIRCGGGMNGDNAAAAAVEEPIADVRAAAAELGLTWPCDKDQVKAAYLQLVKRHHPDKGGDIREFTRLQAAFELIAQKLSIEEHVDDILADVFSFSL